MAVTIKDVAALAGVSPSTVSRTCKNNPAISEETKDKVRRAMAILGYEPNFQASNLASHNSRTIGIILPSSTGEAYENSFYLKVIRGISQYCNQCQYTNTIITGQDDQELLNAVRTMVRSGQAGGFIVLYSKQDDPITQFLDDEGLLYVLIGKAYQFSGQTIYIDNDNLLAAQEATEYLCTLGHRKIAYLGNDSNLMFASDRRAGYQTTLLRHDLPLRNDYCVEVTSVLQDAPDAIRRLLQLKDRPTAVLVSDDLLALSLERVCLELGLSIPTDISIICFNNSLFSRLTSPQLTAIDINSFRLGTEAASQLIHHIENPNLLATKIIVPHFLVERGSCAAVDAQ